MKRLFFALALATAAAACGDIYDASSPGNLVPKTVDEDATLPSLVLADTKFHMPFYATLGANYRF